MKEKIRIDFLDGIRGISALYVVIFHSFLFNQHGIQFSNNFLLKSFEKIASFGYISVAIFIVLSGYYLAIPVINNNLYLKGGFLRYIRRRANRIIPPYYFALVLSLLIIGIFPILQTPYNTAWDSKIPISKLSVLSHFLLIHNLYSGWIYKINGAHWSVATEWQIYFLFPIMLLIWRKSKLIISLVFFAIISFALYKIVPIAHPQYIYLFFIGVISAYYSINRNYKIFYSKYVLIVLLFGIAILLFYTSIRPLSEFILESTIGAIVAIVICIITLAKRQGHNLYIDKLLSKKFPMFLCKISYSLYLIHGVFLALANLLLLQFSIKYEFQLMIMWGLIIPIVICISFVFWWLCERHFLNK